ncbi:hypothetical protein K501DRAFT_274196 [Backusella circina FSU 941]|nr:hypothetical protein K501DRAFT_274196 [Backusella circina FSU 941]
MVKSPYTGDSIDSLAVINRLLISAPALNTLTMSDYSFTLNDLDTLSSVLPHLTSISLIDCTLLVQVSYICPTLLYELTSLRDGDKGRLHVYKDKIVRFHSIDSNVQASRVFVQTIEIESFLVNVTPRLHRLKLYQCNVNIPSLSFPNTRFTLLKIAHDFQSMYQNAILTTAINNETRHYTAKCWSTMENQFKYLFGAHDTPMYPSVECSPNVDYDFKPYIRIRCYSVHDFIIIDHC